MGKRENKVVVFRPLGFDLLGWRNDRIWKEYGLLQSSALSQNRKGSSKASDLVNLFTKYIQ